MPLATEKLRFFISGVNGYLGSFIAVTLANSGHVVYGSASKIPKNNLCEHLKGFFIIDFADFPMSRPVLPEVDIIIHAAGPSAEDCADACAKELQGWAYSFEAFFTLSLSFCRGPFIFLSTANVFNLDNRSQVYNESSIPNNKTAYGRFKFNLERYLQDKYRRQVVILRLPSIFGSHRYARPSAWIPLVNRLINEFKDSGNIHILNKKISRPICSLESFSTAFLQLLLDVHHPTSQSVVLRHFGVKSYTLKSIKSLVLSIGESPLGAEGLKQDDGLLTFTSHQERYSSICELNDLSRAIEKEIHF